ncbi:hypothetical protein HYFRA_00001145 [Hymenoscyphus fraxineus]|uniref:Uncharacterized protein n=1 Tax=Hymenoscyphus fraxineus TaxID=746836 RepID=A0A9N9KSZ3_9HELO|nr:hypothetical protein HYFRA_00001145 [Hymenoscyphus fraxineus]
MYIIDQFKPLPSSFPKTFIYLFTQVPQRLHNQTPIKIQNQPSFIFTSNPFNMKTFTVLFFLTFASIGLANDDVIPGGMVPLDCKPADCDKKCGGANAGYCIWLEATRVIYAGQERNYVKSNKPFCIPYYY